MFDGPTTSFSLHATDPASEAYSILVLYDHYPNQPSLVPTPTALEQCIYVLEALWAGAFTCIIPDGVFNVNGALYRPSYNLVPLTSTDMTWFNANKDSNGIAWKAADYNGDGKMDLECWTADGRQIIYTV